MARIANCRVGFKAFHDEISGHPGLTVISGARIVSAQRRNGGFVPYSVGRAGHRRG